MSEEDESENKGLTTGQWVGVGVGIFAGVVIIVGLIVWAARRNRHRVSLEDERYINSLIDAQEKQLDEQCIVNTTSPENPNNIIGFREGKWIPSDQSVDDKYKLLRADGLRSCYDCEEPNKWLLDDGVWKCIDSDQWNIQYKGAPAAEAGPQSSAYTKLSGDDSADYATYIGNITEKITKPEQRICETNKIKDGRYVFLGKDKGYSECRPCPSPGEWLLDAKGDWRCIARKGTKIPKGLKSTKIKDGDAGHYDCGVHEFRDDCAKVDISTPCWDERQQQCVGNVEPTYSWATKDADVERAQKLGQLIHRENPNFSTEEWNSYIDGMKTSDALKREVDFTARTHLRCPDGYKFKNECLEAADDMPCYSNSWKSKLLPFNSSKCVSTDQFVLNKMKQSAKNPMSRIGSEIREEAELQSQAALERQSNLALGSYDGIKEDAGGPPKGFCTKNNAGDHVNNGRFVKRFGKMDCYSCNNNDGTPGRWRPDGDGWKCTEGRRVKFTEEKPFIPTRRMSQRKPFSQTPLYSTAMSQGGPSSAT